MARHVRRNRSLRRCEKISVRQAKAYPTTATRLPAMVGHASACQRPPAGVLGSAADKRRRSQEFWTLTGAKTHGTRANGAKNRGALPDRSQGDRPQEQRRDHPRPPPPQLPRAGRVALWLL